MFFDALGRTTDKTESFTGSLSATNPDDNLPLTSDTNRQTRDTYNGLDEKLVETSVTYNPQDPSHPLYQTTTYAYGVTKGTNIALNDNSLLSSITYSPVADIPSQGLPALSGMPADTVTKTGYDALGDLTMDVQRNGTTHQYAFDTLGRQTSDKWTSTASYSSSSIGNWADERDTAYDALGRGVKFTMAKAGTPVNQVQRVYDGLGNLVTEYQEHNGAVSTSTSAKVQYTYDTSHDTANNYSRITQTVYPGNINGLSGSRVVSYQYGFYDMGTVGDSSAQSTLNTLNNTISRVGAVADTASPASSNRLEVYEYLGLSTPVQRTYVNVKINNTATTSVDLSYLGQNNVDGVSGDGGSTDPNIGLDRFGRVVYQNWDGVGADRRIYGYDADGNILYAENPDTSIYAKWRSEIFHPNGASADTAYDQLNRPFEYLRGTMTGGDMSAVSQAPIPADGSVDVLTQMPDINYGTPGGTFTKTSETNPPPIDSSRVYQKPRPADSTVFDLGSVLDPSAHRRDTFLTYDAWGDLTGESFASLQWTGTGTNYTHTRDFDNVYQYDALGRRTTEVVTNRNNVTNTVDLYYDTSGHLIQETNTQSGVPTVVTQYVLSAASPGSIILRDDIDPTDSTSRRVWCFQDPTGSTVSLYRDASGGGVSTEHILYTPTGMATFMDHDTTSTSGYSFSDLGQFDWRSVWHGGRLTRDQDYGVYATTTVVDRQSGLINIGGTEFDTTVGSPLLQDKYAFFRPSTGSGELPVNANQYSSRGTVNSAFPLAGSEPTWSENFLSEFTMGAEGQGLGALFNPFGSGGVGSGGGYAYSGQQLDQSWGANFLGSFFSSGSYGAASSVTQPAWVKNTVAISGVVSSVAFTAASFGAYTGALGLAGGALTYAGVGAVGAAAGGAYSYATGGNALSGAENGAMFLTNLGAISPELSAMALEGTAQTGISAGGLLNTGIEEVGAALDQLLMPGVVGRGGGGFYVSKADAELIHPGLPGWQRGQRASGFLNIGGDDIPLLSGAAGGNGTSLLRDGLSRNAEIAAIHLEGHAVAEIVNANATEGVLYINYPEGPCGLCDRGIGELLPQGKKLWVVYPTGGADGIGYGYFEGGSPNFKRIIPE